MVCFTISYILERVFCNYDRNSADSGYAAKWYCDDCKEEEKKSGKFSGGNAR